MRHNDLDYDLWDLVVTPTKTEIGLLDVINGVNQPQVYPSESFVFLLAALAYDPGHLILIVVVKEIH